MTLSVGAGSIADSYSVSCVLCVSLDVNQVATMWEDYRIKLDILRKLLPLVEEQVLEGMEAGGTNLDGWVWL